MLWSFCCFRLVLSCGIFKDVLIILHVSYFVHSLEKKSLWLGPRILLGANQEQSTSSIRVIKLVRIVRTLRIVKTAAWT